MSSAADEDETDEIVGDHDAIQHIVLFLVRAVLRSTVVMMPIGKSGVHGRKENANIGRAFNCWCLGHVPLAPWLGSWKNVFPDDADTIAGICNFFHWLFGAAARLPMVALRRIVAPYDWKYPQINNTINSDRILS